MERRIVGFHKDEEGHWVADLECGHGQHVRHDPPWMNRPWTQTEEGRAEKRGQLLNCKRCDEDSPMGEFERLLPDFPAAYRAARAIAPSAPDLEIARTGFRRHLSADAWTPERAAFVQHRLDNDLSEAALEDYEEQAAPIRAFTCFALGALLALYARGQLDDRGFQIANIQLPGFLIAEYETVVAVLDTAP